MKSRKFYLKCGLFFLFSLLVFILYFVWIFLSLPRLMTVADYKPPLLTEVYDRRNNKIGEFFEQRRLLFKYEDMPPHLIEAFVAAEDGSFFSHGGLNYLAILRALIVNFKEGEKVQGGSTITQQLARTLLLTSEKTYTRKFKEAVLALRMESVFSKQDILYIYLNQIYMGHGAYGVEMASRIYFRKSIKDISLAEAALLAGLPKAPSRFSPIHNPSRAKSRQIYVLKRMWEEDYITREVFEETAAQPLKVYMREDFNSQSPYYLETVRRLLLKKLSQKEILENGLRVYTAMDLNLQQAAQIALTQGLEELDKRQGYRKESLFVEETQWEDFIKKTADNLKKQLTTYLILPGASLKEESKETHTNNDSSDSTALFEDTPSEKSKALNQQKELKESAFPWQDHREQLEGKTFKGILTKVTQKQMQVLTPWGQEILYLKDLAWAVPVEEKLKKNTLTDLRDIFKKNQVITLRAEKREEEIVISFYQKPLVQGALLSFDLETSDIVALVGGYDYDQSQFNRAWQANRQPGSVFKPFIYAAALEKGFHPASVIGDAPVVFTDKEAEEKTDKDNSKEDDDSPQDAWKPSNISNRFYGDLLFRTALIRSLNVPTVKIIQRIGLKWTQFYAKCMGLFNPLNPDYTTALGSSALNLYEISKAYSLFARQGMGFSPLLVHRVENQFREELFVDLSLDEMFKNQITKTEEFLQTQKNKWFPEESRNPRNKEWLKILSRESDRRIPANQSYIMTDLLQAVVSDLEGTGGRARILKRKIGGKTGTTDGFYDAWFVGYSPFISTGVWVGFDEEKTLGQGETGSKTALPLWINYMKEAHENLPDKDFPVPEGIIFVNIDAETGALTSSETKKVVRQAFSEGTEPKDSKSKGENPKDSEEESFIREDLAY